MKLRVTRSIKVYIVLFILLVLLLYSFTRIETFTMGGMCKEMFGPPTCSLNPKYFNDGKYGTDTVTQWDEYCKSFGDIERKCLKSHDVTTGDFYDEIKGYIVPGEPVTYDDLCIYTKGGTSQRVPAQPDMGQWDKPLGTIGI